MLIRVVCFSITCRRPLIQPASHSPRHIIQWYVYFYVCRWEAKATYAVQSLQIGFDWVDFDVLHSLTCLPHLFAYRAPPVVCPCHSFRIVAVRRGGVCECHFVVDTCGYTHQDTTLHTTQRTIPSETSAAADMITWQPPATHPLEIMLLAHRTLIRQSTRETKTERVWWLLQHAQRNTHVYLVTLHGL